MGFWETFGNVSLLLRSENLAPNKGFSVAIVHKGVVVQRVAVSVDVVIEGEDLRVRQHVVQQSSLNGRED